ncbi:MAG: WXG100 family type VII secretion target [Dietzia sp.]|nr:WXG100 family type VII secretion target [Dietzia sp.]
MALFGQDIDQVRQLAAQLNAMAGDIESVISQLTSAVDSVQWMGPDAERFKSEWKGQHVPQLRQVVSALQAASQNASRNASEQQQAST